MKDLNKNLNFLRTEMDKEVSSDDTLGMVEKLEKLVCLVGLSAECVAASEKELKKKNLIVLIENKESNYSPSVLIKYMDGLSADELAAYKYAERLNAGLSHAMDGLRTIISLHKEEMNKSKF